MGFVTTEDGAEIYFKDWGPKDAQPIMFHHGWPLSSDDWDAQLLYFLDKGYRVIASDRRGHGRSSQIGTGHDMDHYASDASAVVEHLDLRNAIHIGHSTGGGQVARYVAKYGEPQGRVAKAVLVASVPPIMLQSESNPEGTPLSVLDGFREALAAAGDDRQPPGQCGLAGRGERRRLLMAHVHPLQAAVPAQGVGESVQRIARQPPDALHSRATQGVHDHFGDVHSHAPAPLDGDGDDCPSHPAR